LSASARWFIAVGALAAMVHVGVFEATRHVLQPEIANLIGFGIAFLVSFYGHRFLSFTDAGTSLGTSFGRFAVTALAGLATNEAVFVLLFRVLDWPATLALLCGLLLAAVQTFMLTRFWAFRR
jgi:putative flippase GtrA